MKPLRARVRWDGWRPAALVLLLAVSGTPVARAAADAAPAAAPPAKPDSAPMSPHARAARERALAQAGAAAPGIRVSPYTNRRKPHKPPAAR
jgi:hypothetical protein